jgi:hypothetical protein
MIKLTKPRGRRLRKMLHVGEFQDLAYPIEEAIADRSIEFASADGQIESTNIFLWSPIQVGLQHWRCPFLIQSRNFEEGAYNAGIECNASTYSFITLDSGPFNGTSKKA